mmetsp:Transcript_60099/g.190920  ORF Transcript_60099/g.190920 Transcript_60099/m.190920 type:complete len:140 (-) Transcript_60099:131-550(-)
MAGWTVYVAFGFPIPLVLICLLTVPLPRPLAKPFLMFTNSLLGLKFVGSVPLLYFMIGLTGAAFAVNSASTWKAIDYPAGLSPNEKTAVLAKKWRAERNFWIAFFSFVLWCLLQRVYQMRKRLDELEAARAEEESKKSK